MIENELSNNNEKIIKLMGEMNKIFNLFNQHFYKGELEAPMILIQTNARESRVAGWCTTKKIWKDNDKSEYYYEISISAEFLYREVRETCATLLHEMVHLYCRQNNIKDTSRGFTYHNAKFKEVAEQHGLVIDYDKRIGWSLSFLNKEAADLADKEIDKTIFSLTRKNHKGSMEEKEKDNQEDVEDEGTKKKSSSKRYICPDCGIIVRATKEVKIICGECGSAFEEKEKEEE